MDWTTVYDISEVNYIWIDITCAVMCLFSAIIIFAEIQAVKEQLFEEINAKVETY